MLASFSHAAEGPAHVLHLLPVVHRLRLEPEIAQLEQPHVGAVHRRQQRLCQRMVGREQIEVARNHANLQSGLLHLRLGLRQGGGRVVRVDRMAGPHRQVIAVVAVPLCQFDQFGNTLFLEHLAENDQFHALQSPLSAGHCRFTSHNRCI